MKRILVFSACLMAGAAFGLDVTTDTVVDDSALGTYAALTSADDLSIADGVTLDFQNTTTPLELKAKLSGGGTLKATRAAKLTLSGDNAAFVGAFNFTETPVDVKHVNALGSASVDFTGVAVNDANRLTFCVAATYANDFRFHDLWQIEKTDDITFTGKLTLGVKKVGSNKAQAQLGPLHSGADPEVGKFTFAGEIVGDLASGAQVYTYADAIWTEGLQIRGFSDGASSFFINSGADVHIYNDLNTASDFVGFYLKGNVICEREDIFSRGSLQLGTTASPSAGYNLKGHDQTITTLIAPTGTLASSCATIVSTAPATLSITNAANGGSASKPCNVDFGGAVSLVFGDGVNDNGMFYFINTVKKGKSERFSSGMTGTVTLRSGTLRLGEGCTFTAVSGVYIEKGLLQIDAGTDLNETDIYVTSAARLSFPADASFRCARLFLADATSPTGYRQLAQGNYAAGSGELADIVVQGSLEVLSSPPVTAETLHWTGDAGDDLTTPGSWAEGTAPDGDAANALLFFATRGDTATLSADLAVAGVQVDAPGKAFTLGGAGHTLDIGSNGLAVAAGNVFTNFCGLGVGDVLTGADWTFGAGATAAFNGPFRSQNHDRPLTLAGAGDNTLLFAADSPELGVAIVVTNVATAPQSVVATATNAFGPKGLVAYNTLPYFRGVSTNVSPITICDIQQNFKTAFYEGTSFVQLGDLHYVAHSIASGDRPYVTVPSGNDLTLGGNVTFEGARSICNLGENSHLRFAGERVMAADQLDFRGENGDNSVVHLQASLAGLESSFFMGAVRVVCEADDCLPTNVTISLGIQSSNLDSQNRLCVLDLNGHDEKVGVLALPNIEKMNVSDACKAQAHAEVTSATSATLTYWWPKKHSGTSAGLPLRFQNQAALRHDVEGFVLMLSNTISRTEGALTVARGEVKFVSGYGWDGPVATVCAGAQLTIDATAAATAFRQADGRLSRTSLVLEDGCTLRLVKGGPAVVVAHAYRPDGSHTAAELRELGRSGLPRGLYASPEYDGDENVTKVDWIMGKGLLRVVGSNGLKITIR